MPSKPPTYYWDACVLLAYVNEEAGRIQDIDAMLAEAARNDIVLITSVLSVAEVAFGAMERTGRVLDPDVEARIDKLWAPVGPVRLVEFQILIAERAKRIRREAMIAGDLPRLPSVDVMHMATAQQEKVSAIHTYEPKWRQYARLVALPITEPQPTQPALGLPPA